MAEIGETKSYFPSSFAKAETNGEKNIKSVLNGKEKGKHNLLLVYKTNLKQTCRRGK